MTRICLLMKSCFQGEYIRRPAMFTLLTVYARDQSWCRCASATLCNIRCLRRPGQKPLMSSRFCEKGSLALPQKTLCSTLKWQHRSCHELPSQCLCCMLHGAERGEQIYDTLAGTQAGVT